MRLEVIGELEEFLAYRYNDEIMDTIDIDSSPFAETHSLHITITLQQPEKLNKALNIIKTNWYLRCYCMRPKGITTFMSENQGIRLTRYYYKYFPYSNACRDYLFAMNELEHFKRRLRWWVPFKIRWYQNSSMN